MEFRPPHCLSPRRSYKSPIFTKYVVGPTSPGFHGISHPGKAKEEPGRVLVQLQRILNTTGSPCNEPSTRVQKDSNRAGHLGILGALWDTTSAESQEPEVLVPETRV